MSQINRRSVGPNGTGPVYSLSDTLGAKTFPDGDGDIQLRSTNSAMTIVAGASELAFTVVTTGMPWQTISGGPNILSVNTGYITNDASTPTDCALPAGAAVGDMIWVVSRGVAGFDIDLSTNGQTVVTNDTVPPAELTGTAAILTSGPHDGVQLLCIVAGSTWLVVNSVGSLTLI